VNAFLNNERDDGEETLESLMAKTSCGEEERESAFSIPEGS